MNQADRLYLTEIVTQLKLAEKKKREAEEDLEVWVERMEKARAAQRDDLYAAAKQRAEAARDAVHTAEAQIMELEVERDDFKRKIRTKGGEASLKQAHQLIDSLKGTDLDPSDMELRRIEREQSADSALDALKRRMQEDS